MNHFWKMQNGLIICHSGFLRYPREYSGERHSLPDCYGGDQDGVTRLPI